MKSRFDKLQGQQTETRDEGWLRELLSPLAHLAPPSSVRLAARRRVLTELQKEEKIRRRRAAWWRRRLAIPVPLVGAACAAVIGFGVLAYQLGVMPPAAFNGAARGAGTGLAAVVAPGVLVFADSPVIANGEQYLGRFENLSGQVAVIDFEGGGRIECALAPFANAKPDGRLTAGHLTVEDAAGLRLDVYAVRSGGPAAAETRPVWVRATPAALDGAMPPKATLSVRGLNADLD